MEENAKSTGAEFVDRLKMVGLVQMEETGEALVQLRYTN
jgi:hypothetical protein